jgi:hypothetical protein
MPIKRKDNPKSVPYPETVYIKDLQEIGRKAVYVTPGDVMANTSGSGRKSFIIVAKYKYDGLVKIEREIKATDLKGKE